MTKHKLFTIVKLNRGRLVNSQMLQETTCNIFNGFVLTVIYQKKLFKKIYSKSRLNHNIHTYKPNIILEESEVLFIVLVVWLSCKLY